MPTDAYIIDEHNNRVEINALDGEKKALCTTTRPEKSYTNKVKFFSNSDYGVSINQDASVGGSPATVHTGTDGVFWTGTSIVGGDKFTFDSTDQNHTPGGTKSVKIDNAPVGDTLQFGKGSNLDVTGYVSLSLWVYVDKDWKAGDVINIYGYDTGVGSIIGNALDMKRYFNYLTYDVWQKISIPLTDFGTAFASSTVLDALRINIVAAEGKSPKFYLDDIQFEESGTPIEFSIKPDVGTWLHISSLNLQMIDEYDSTVLNGTMPKIPPNGFLGVGELSVGVVYQRWIEDEIVNSYSIKKTADVMMFSRAQVTGSGYDGTYTWVNILIEFTESVILKYETNDKLSITISEDLSGLTNMRMAAGCKEETR